MNTEIKLIEVVENPQPGFKITAHHFWELSWVILVIALFLKYFTRFNLDDLSFEFILLLVIMMLGVRIWSWYEYYPIKHISKEIVTLNLDKIIYNNQKFEIKDLEYLMFDIIDYKGERINSSFAEPSLSQGVNNFIKFKYHEKEENIQFQLSSKSELVLLSQFLYQLHLHGQNFTETYKYRRSYHLRYLNYKEIQEYKELKGSSLKNQITLITE